MREIVIKFQCMGGFMAMLTLIVFLGGPYIV